MTDLAFKAAFYGLGFVGLAGITIIWLRVWQLARGEFVALWRTGTVARTMALVIVPLCGWALYVWVATIRRVLACLTNPPCGPDRAAGWIQLAFFGGVYFFVEIALLLGRTTRRPG